MQDEIKQAVNEALPQLDSKTTQLVISRFCEITLPTDSAPPLDTKLYSTRIRSERDSEITGINIKPGNLLLNMRKLLDNSAEIVLTAAGAISTPMLIPFAALVIWNKFWANVKVELNEAQATLIWIMWANRDKSRNWIEDSKAHRIFNEKTSNSFTPAEYDRIAEDLVKLKCIERTGDGETWWLRERVRVEI